MNKRTPAERAKALGLVAAGLTQAKAAEACGVPVNTVRSWKRRHGRQMASIRKSEEFGELVLEFAKQMMRANARLCELLQDGDYVRSKEPAGVGTLAGILNDKCGRVLDVLASIRAADEDDA